MVKVTFIKPNITKEESNKQWKRVLEVIEKSINNK